MMIEAEQPVDIGFCEPISKKAQASQGPRILQLPAATPERVAPGLVDNERRATIRSRSISSVIAVVRSRYRQYEVSAIAFRT